MLQPVCVAFNSLLQPVSVPLAPFCRLIPRRLLGPLPVARLCQVAGRVLLAAPFRPELSLFFSISPAISPARSFCFSNLFATVRAEEAKRGGECIWANINEIRSQFSTSLPLASPAHFRARHFRPQATTIPRRWPLAPFGRLINWAQLAGRLRGELAGGHFRLGPDAWPSWAARSVARSSESVANQSVWCAGDTTTMSKKNNQRLWRPIARAAASERRPNWARAPKKVARH